MGKDATVRFESRDSLFPIYLWRYRIENCDALNRDLLAEIAERRESEPGMDNTMSRYGWQSDRDLFRRTEPAHTTLALAINQMLGEAIEGLGRPGALKGMELVANGWVNINPPGGYNAPHVHPEALLSGTYYVSVPKGTNPVGGAIEFNVPHPTIKLQNLLNTPMLAERIRVVPEPGMVLMFPGTLSHWVHPNDSGEDRVSVSFNGVIRPKASPRGAAPRRS
jgi:uncharacterized protein (TIGR02466 family)